MYYDTIIMKKVDNEPKIVQNHQDLCLQSFHFTSVCQLKNWCDSSSLNQLKVGTHWFSDINVQDE